MSTTIRQGDILFVYKGKESPKGTFIPGRKTVAFGEATGHAHAVEGVDADLYVDESGNVISVRVRKPTRIVHEEHNPISLREGTWEVVHQREYDPEEGKRRVKD